VSALPIQYNIEVYEGSFSSDVVWHAEATSPFPGISIGDRFNHRGIGNGDWASHLTRGQCFRVKEIDHMFWTIKGSHIGHKLMVALELGEIKD
jgi:hypothetical protein